MLRSSFVPHVGETSVAATVRLLAASLCRPISLEGSWVVQQCPLCEVALRIHESRAQDVDELVQEMFGFYDAHRCTQQPDEAMYQRAERASVQLGERALALANDPAKVVLARRAERESIKLAAWVETFLKR